MIPPVMTTDPLPATKRKKKQKKSAPVRKEKSRNVKRKKETEVQMKRQKEHRYSGRICFPEVSYSRFPNPCAPLEKKEKKKRDEPLRPAQLQDSHHGDKEGHYEKKEGNISKKRVRPGATKRRMTHLAPIPANAQMTALGEFKLDVSKCDD
jgi:hypothetical protein